MGFTDLPVQQLHQFVGRNPRPDDFDAYWDEALAELGSVTANVEMTPATFQVPQVECFDLFFTGVRGARLHAKYLRPSNATTPQPAVVMFHGYGANSGDWFSKLPYALAGHCVFALDVRGQGGASSEGVSAIGPAKMGQIVRGLEDAKQNLFFRHVFLDAVELVRLAMNMPEVNPDRVSVTGASQGGGLSLACAALEPRVHAVAAVYPFLGDYLRAWEMGADASAYGEVFEYFRRRDPQHLRHDDIFTRLGYIDVQHLAPRIACPVLMATGLMDAAVPPSTQFAAYNRIQSEKRVLIYPELGHDDIPGLADEILQWIVKS